jgi:hypothetical protein
LHQGYPESQKNTNPPSIGTMKKPYFIVAGNYTEYIGHVNIHCMEYDLSTTQVIFLDDISIIKGAKKILDPDGIFIGSWKERTDIKDIVLELFALTLDSKKCDILTKVYNSL